MFDNKFNNLKKFEKLFLYDILIVDYIIIDAVFSDETGNFVNPVEPSSKEPIEVKIRTAHSNVDKIFYCEGEEKYPMSILESDETFDYHYVKLEPTEKIRKYFFQLIKDDKTFYYNRRGLYLDLDNSYNFTIIPDFKTPDWSKGAIMYQIFVDRFFNGDKENDVKNFEYLYLGKASKKIEDWNTPLENEDICNFYGGDLKGVMDKMNYLKELGIEVIYFNPIFVSPSNHKYDTQDYDYVDPHYGVIINSDGETLDNTKLLNRNATMYIERTTNKENLEASNKLMIDLIDLAHKSGIKVILDGVFNHCGAFNKWLDKEGFYSKAGYPVGAYREKDSIYNNYFRWYDENWPNNDCYDSWWGHDNHPKLNVDNCKELYDYIIDVGVKWVSPPFNADGWRLDVAADLGYTPELNHKFWTDFRSAVKLANPNALILAEHYGDPQDWLLGDQWDSVMNYDAFMEPLTWFLTGMEKHSEEFKPDMLNNAMSFEKTMRYFMSRFSYPSLFSAMNELSNHDHSRFLTRTNMTVGRLHTKGSNAADKNLNFGIMMEAILFQMTWPGAPTIYYGDEVGLTGWSDPDNRRPFPWGKENNLFLNLQKHVNSVHKKSKALRKGSVEFLYSNYGIISYGRWLEDESIVTILNNDSNEKDLTIPVWKAQIENDSDLYQIVGTTKNEFFTENKKFIVANGQLQIKMPPFSGIVLSNKIF